MSDGPEHVARPLWVNAILLAAAGAIFVTMVLLGNWQVARLAWKLELIETVEARAFGVAEAAPAAPRDIEGIEYERVFVEGIFDHAGEARVKALTEAGPGHWVMVPFVVNEARVIWVNRGFVPPGAEVVRPDGVVRVEGLVRQSVPGGTLMERNDPSADRWVSVDIEALSAARGVTTEGYYIDADHAAAPETWPRGGMTRVTFRNNHLSYALTWYAMAVLFAGAIVWVVRDVMRGRAG